MPNASSLSERKCGEEFVLHLYPFCLLIGGGVMLVVDLEHMLKVPFSILRYGIWLLIAQSHGSKSSLDHPVEAEYLQMW